MPDAPIFETTLAPSPVPVSTVIDWIDHLKAPTPFVAAVVPPVATKAVEASRRVELVTIFEPALMVIVSFT